MRIASFYKRYNSISRTATTHQTSQTSQTGRGVSTKGVTTPDYANMLTKRTPSMTESGYRQKIVAQAKADAANGTYQKSAGYKTLEQSYVSCMSPDRQSVITSTMKKLGGRMPSNMSFYDGNGNKIADWNPTKHSWDVVETGAEKARQKAFHNLYDQTYQAAAKTTAKK